MHVVKVRVPPRTHQRERLESQPLAFRASAPTCPPRSLLRRAGAHSGRRLSIPSTLCGHQRLPARHLARLQQSHQDFRTEQPSPLPDLRGQPHNVASGNILRIEQLLNLQPPPVERVAGVPRVLRDRPHCGVLPAVVITVAVLTGSVPRRTQDTLPVQNLSDPLERAQAKLGQPVKYRGQLNAAYATRKAINADSRGRTILDCADRRNPHDVASSQHHLDLTSPWTIVWEIDFCNTPSREQRCQHILHLSAGSGPADRQRPGRAVPRRPGRNRR